MEAINEHTWKIESLRLTIFTRNDFNGYHLENWLKEISKNDPLSINKSINHFQGISQINSSMLNLGWNNNRVDLFLNSNAPSIENNIGNYNEISILMKDVFFPFFNFKECPLSNRLAIGIILNIPIKNFEEGNAILQPKLKWVQNINGTTDFIYRINRPFHSKIIKNLKLNRLMKWSLGLYNLSLQDNLKNVTSELECRFEMDFNTIPKEELEFTADQQKEITMELLMEAMKIVEMGEYGTE